MSTNNKVFQVLVAKGNQPLAAAGTSLDALADGQLGIFDVNTNLAVPATAVKKFFLAVGVDSNGDGTIDNIVTSAGQEVQKENIRDFTFKPHTAARPMILEITDLNNIKCETEYAIKFEFRNSQIYARQGYVQYTKTFGIKTECCDGSDAGINTDLVKKFLEAFNADESGMFKAEAITGASGTVIADLDAYVADEANLAVLGNVSLRITSNDLAIQKYCDINLQYHNLRQTVIIPSLIEGFNCTGKVTITQNAASEEGSGYDIKQKEYHAGGWNGKPGVYRASSALGLAMPGFDYMADASLKYDQFHLVYDQFSTAGWGEYLNNLMTVIAIPATSTVTRDAFATAMNVQLGPLGFETLVDDAAAASTDPDVVETTPPASSDLDGIA